MNVDLRPESSKIHMLNTKVIIAYHFHAIEGFPCLALVSSLPSDRTCIPGPTCAIRTPYSAWVSHHRIFFFNFCKFICRWKSEIFFFNPIKIEVENLLKFSSSVDYARRISGISLFALLLFASTRRAACASGPWTLHVRRLHQNSVKTMDAPWVARGECALIFPLTHDACHKTLRP